MPDELVRRLVQSMTHTFQHGPDPDGVARALLHSPEMLEIRSSLRIHFDEYGPSLDEIKWGIFEWVMSDG